MTKVTMSSSVFTYIQVCMSLWKREGDVKCLPLFFSTLFFRQGLSLFLELPDVAAGCLTEQGAPWFD